jgi:hypothetical protein
LPAVPTGAEAVGLGRTGEEVAMRYSRYGDREFSGVTQSRQRVRPGPERPDGGDPAISLPPGVSEREASLLLEVFARLKEKRFGRVEVSLRGGNVTDVKLVEKVDRRLFESLAS